MSNNIMKLTTKELLIRLRTSSNLMETTLWNYLKYDEYISLNYQSLKDKNKDIRAEIVELIGKSLLKSDVYILRKLADFEVEYTRKLNYHNCLGEIVFYLYELGNKEDVIYAYEIRNSSNMDASFASFDQTLSMRTPKKEMISYLENKIKDDSFFKKYPSIISSTKWAYDFEDYEMEEDFMDDFAGYYGFDTTRIKKFDELE